MQGPNMSTNFLGVSAPAFRVDMLSGRFYSVCSQNSAQSDCPRMPPYFFISCAQADDGPAVERFFRDLSDSIRVRERLPVNETVGCFDVAQNSETRDEGLRTSGMMLALVSANYLRDHAAERDWQTFALRKAPITRINWSRNPNV